MSMANERDQAKRSWGRNPFEVLVYLAAAPLLHGLARLPLRVLYRLSDLTFWFAYRVLRLRRAVARDNLRRSFPEATRGRARSHRGALLPAQL